MFLNVLLTIRNYCEPPVVCAEPEKRAIWVVNLLEEIKLSYSVSYFKRQVI